MRPCRSCRSAMPDHVTQDQTARDVPDVCRHARHSRGWSAWRLEEAGAVSQRILSENYESVVAAQSMKESLERLDSATLFAELGRTDRAQRQLEEHRRAVRRGVRPRGRQHHRAGRARNHRGDSPGTRRILPGPRRTGRLLRAHRAAVRHAARRKSTACCRSIRRRCCGSLPMRNA